jgi:hypothetical protein
MVEEAAFVGCALIVRVWEHDEQNILKLELVLFRLKHNVSCNS